MMRLKCPKLKLKMGKEFAQFSFEKNFEIYYDDFLPYFVVVVAP